LHVVERFCKSETHLHIAEGHFHKRERDVARTNGPTLQGPGWRSIKLGNA
jgi:hypothetical protein